MKKIVLPQMIDYYRKQNNLTMKDLGKLLDKSESAISRWIKGERSPMVDDLDKLAKIFDTSVETLMFGAGNVNILSIYEKLENSRKERVYIYAKNELSKQQENSLKSSKSQAEVIQFQPKRKQKPKTVIALGYASAGTGEFLVDEQKIETTYYGSIPDYDYALIVNGDSMEPMFQDGQIIFVDKLDGDTSFLDGQIVIAELNGCAYIKKLRLYSDHAQLISMNNRYDPIEVSVDDEFMIVGKVIL